MTADRLVTSGQSRHPSRALPVIDIAGARGGDEPSLVRAGRAIDLACVEHGFFAIVGHGVDLELLADLRREARAFFVLPTEVKERCSRSPEDAHGYLGSGRTALAATLGDPTPPDLSESFSMRGVDDFGPGAGSRDGRDLWPAEPAGLRRAFVAYYEALEELTFALLPVFASALDLPRDWFDDKFRGHATTLIVNWYPPVVAAPRPGQLRRGAHTDYGAFTILAADDVPGLEISVTGEWSPVPFVADAFVVNIGDLMARWTNDRWVSTLHRVVPPSGPDSMRERMSVPFFVHPRPDALIETVPSAVSDDRPAHYEPVVSGEWISAKSLSMLESQ